jgi:hypothetical protein
MKVQRGISHHWWTSGGKLVKATAEPSTEEKLIVVALDATAKALEVEFKEDKPVAYPLGRWTEGKP